MTNVWRNGFFYKICNTYFGLISSTGDKDLTLCSLDFIHYTLGQISVIVFHHRQTMVIMAMFQPTTSLFEVNDSLIHDFFNFRFSKQVPFCIVSCNRNSAKWCKQDLLGFFP